MSGDNNTVRAKLDISFTGDILPARNWRKVCANAISAYLITETAPCLDSGRRVD